MRIIFKILAAPFVVVLPVFVAVVFFLVEVSEWLLNLDSGLMAVIGAEYLFTGVTFHGLWCSCSRSCSPPSAYLRSRPGLRKG